MDIEQMKLLIDALGQAGGEAKSVIMFWLIRDGLVCLGGGLLIVLGAVLAYKLIRGAINQGAIVVYLSEKYRQHLEDHLYSPFTVSDARTLVETLEKEKE